jgi:mono/diheme cytochrome c family protein
MHRDVFDVTCSTCHDTGNPGGTDNTSFCSNSACHGNVFTYAGFDAPALREILKAQLPPPAPAVEIGSGPLAFEATIGPLLVQHCGACHGAGGMMGLDLTSYDGVSRGGQNGPAITPGDSAGSLLIQIQTSPQGHFANFNPEELEAIRQWIDQGAPEK